MDNNDNKKVVYAGRHINMIDRNGWEYAERSRIVTGIVAIIASTEKHVILVEQYRPPCGGRVIEFPAGLVGDKQGFHEETLLEAAKRELEEETGYAGDNFIKVAEGPASAGITSEVITLYRVSDVKKVGPGGGDESEKIKVHLAPIDSIDEWLQEKVAQGLQIDLKVYSGLYFLKDKNV
ncbi:NUDIX hydrolase [bacterium]|nr:NUDIX hydrolase [bacterium]